MSSASSATVYAQSNGVVSLGSLGIIPFVSDRDPTSTDIKGPSGPFKIGQVWVNKTDDDAFILSSFSATLGDVTAVWTSMSAAAGSVSELDGDSGTAMPSGGAITVAGTAGEITTSGAGAQITIALASPMTAPGNLTVTGTLGVTGATTLAALTQVGAASINATGSATTTIGSAAAGAISLDTTAGITLNADTASSFTTTDAAADLSLTATLGRVIVTAGENAADAIYLHADAGISETIRIHSDQGTGAASVELVSDVGGVTLTSGLASSDAINFSASAGGIDMDAALDIVITSTENAADSILLHANGGISESIRLHSDQGTAVGSVQLESDVGGITLLSGLASSDAINLTSSAGGVDVDAALDIVLTSTEDAADSIYLHANGGTSETIRLHSDLGTGAASVHLESDVGGVTLTSGLASSDAINFSATAGGIDMDAALDIVITSTEDAADSILLHANGGTSESIRLHSDLGTAVGSIQLESDVGGITLLSGLASTDSINVTSSAGGVDIDGALEINITSSEAAVADAITLSASAADGGITLDSGATPGVTFTNGTQSHQLLVGSGSPNTVVSASQGSMYIDVGGSTSTTILFVNTDGATAWVGVGA